MRLSAPVSVVSVPLNRTLMTLMNAEKNHQVISARQRSQRAIEQDADDADQR